MSYAAFETSTQSGAPVELFEFVQGAQTWRYTSYDVDYTWGGHTWTSAPIGRGEIEQNNEINQAGINLRFPRSNDFAMQFVTAIPEQITTVTVRRGHAGDPDADFEVSWKGRVVGGTGDGAEINIGCESVYTSLRRPGLRARYQRQCRHVLYQRGCRVEKANFAVTAAIASLSGTTMTVPAAADYPDGWFAGGYFAAPDGSLRFIMRHAGAVLLLSRPHAALAALVSENGYGKNYGNYYGGVPAILYPGCDMSQATCKDKYANLVNYGGFPYIPSKNPLGGSSIV